MIDKLLQKHLNRDLDDIDDRRYRVWHKIYAHMKAELVTQEVGFTAFRYWGLAPLVVTLLLVVLGSGALNVFGRSLPGDKLYGVKRAVEEAQLKVATDPETKTQLQIGLIEKRVHEITQLENRSAQKETVAAVKAEVGQKAIAFVADTAEPATSAADEVKAVNLATVSIADAKVVGEAVTEFLKSTILTGKAKEDKIKEIVETVLAADNEDKADPADEPAKPAELTPKPTEPAEDRPESKIIEDEIESDDLEIK